MKKVYITMLMALACLGAIAQSSAKLQAKLDQKAKELETKVIEWRRHFHQYPELSNREFKTGKMIADHLKS